MATDPSMLSDWYESYLKSNPAATAATATAPTVTPTEWKPDEASTVAGQLTKITAAGSPLIDQAQTMAKQEANKRGMLNSSMAVTAGQDAAYRVALPIAQQDASTFASAGQFNAGAKNSAATTNATLANSTNQFNASAQNAATQQQTAAGVQSAQLAQQYEEQRKNLTAQTDEQLRLLDAQNGTKLADAYRTTSQTTYDAYITDVQRIQESDMDADVKAAQIANLQGLYQTRQEYINTIFKFSPGWSNEWSQFAVEFGETAAAGG